MGLGVQGFRVSGLGFEGFRALGFSEVSPG